ncbi:MAG: SPASM domain-containing protein, partial [Candidatus Eremiobacteraeota bacterium]|nr:SPASM domain-containing protein [Candidatus Eremiobacteraeota bacterium]
MMGLTDSLPRVTYQVTIHPGGKEYIEEILEYAARIGVDGINLVRLQLAFSPGLVRPARKEEKEIISHARKLGKKLGIQVDSVSAAGPLLLLATRFDTFCIRLDDYAYITVKGDLAPCCNLRDDIAGSLLDENLEDLFKAPEIRNLWWDLSDPVCKKCDAFRYNYADEITTVQKRD